jgi:hypothetical protein
VRIRAAQPLQSSVRFEAIETAAIWVDSVDVLVAPSSGSLLSLDPGAPGLESVRIDYTVSSTFTASPPYDEAQLLVRRNDGARTLLGTVPIPTPRSGTFLWSGELSTAGTRVTPGEYTVEVEVLQAGRSLGTSARHAVSAYRIQLALKPLCIDDATNATTGIFVPRTPPLPLPLDRLKFLTAPVTVEAKSIVGTATKVVLELDSGDPGSIGVFNARTGAVESLPKTWLGADFDAAQRLEVKLLAQGVASGTTVLRVRYEANGTTIGERKLKLRVNDMPGIAGVPVVADPKFLYGRVFNQGDTIRAAIDPLIFVDRAGRKATAHVVRHKTPAQWAMDNTIVPLASKEVTITAGNISVADLGNALAANDLELPDDKGYDIVYDFGTCPADPAAYAGDLRLDPGDIVDSILPDRPSVTVLPNLLAAGKYGVGSADFGTGASPATTKVPKGFDMLDVPVDFDFRLRGQLHFPDPMPAGKLPLVVIAHGNHAPLQFPMMPRTSPNLTSNENYLGYEYLQRHLASHGYITASIDLDQMYGDPPLPIINGSGIQLRAYVLLRNIEELLKNASIAGGKLVGAIDPQRVYLVGHSRGGEAVVVAQEMYASNTDNPAAPSPRPIGSASFDAGIGIKGIVSVSPVSVHAVALPSAMPYLLLYGSADGDVNGFTPGVQPFVHYDRARGAASLVYALGANHNYFNDSWAYSDANQDVTCTAIDMCTIVAKPVLPGTNLNPFSRAQQRDLLRAYTLAFLDRHDKTGFLPYEAYLNNPPELLRPLGIPAAVPLTAAWKALPGVARQVMDDYESNPNVLLASSGAAVAPTVANIAEAPLTSSTAATQRFYQATQGVVFDWASSAGYKFVPTAPIDFRGAALSFRIAQQPLAAQTILLNGPLTLGVRVSDGVNSSAVTLAAWGAAGSVYPSSAYVPGLTLTTKAAFETRVVPWWAFSANGSAVDLNHITEISFEFGGIATSPTGRIAIDDVEVLR